MTRLRKPTTIPEEAAAEAVATLTGLGDVEKLNQALSEASTTPGQPVLRFIPRGQLAPGKWLSRDRERLDRETLGELADSIRQDGVRVPLEAVEAQGIDGYYTFFAGLRRWLAAEIAGVEALPVLVYPDLPDAVAQRYSLLTNLHRQDLAPMEQARGLQKLESTGMTQQEIAASLGVSQAFVSQRLAFLGLPAVARQALEEGQIGIAEARELAKIKDDGEAVAAVLNPDGRKLSRAIGGGWVPAELSKRVEHVVRVRAEQQKLRAEVAKLREEGYQIIEPYTYGDHKYVIIEYGEERAVHEKLGMTCLAYGVSRDEIKFLCTDPEALKKAMRKARSLPEDKSAYEEMEAEMAALEKVRQSLREDAITRAINTLVVGEAQIVQIAKTQLGAMGHDARSILGRWLGLNGKAKQKIVDSFNEYLRVGLEEWPNRQVLQLWALSLVAEGTSQYTSAYGARRYKDIFLEDAGYIDPFPQPVFQGTDVRAALEKVEGEAPGSWAEIICRKCGRLDPMPIPHATERLTRAENQGGCCWHQVYAVVVEPPSFDDEQIPPECRGSDEALAEIEQRSEAFLRMEQAEAEAQIEITDEEWCEKEREAVMLMTEQTGEEHVG